MKIAIILLTLQALIGAFDTIYFHEWRARLPARAAQVAAELRVHAIRDFLYAVLFATLGRVAWHGRFVLILVTIFVAEILLTLADFVIEARVRKPLGDVFAGERVTHSIMGIIYGAMLANLTTTLLAWWQLPTGFVLEGSVSSFHRIVLDLMAIGVAASGVRDLAASSGARFAAWPWRVEAS
jgi:hypothetical protein